MRILASLLAFLLASTSALAQTTIVWDNFSTDDTYKQYTGGWAGTYSAGPEIGTANGTASAFTPTGSGQFDSFTASIHGINASNPMPLTLTLTTSVGGQFGTSLWTTTTQTLGNSDAGLFSLTGIGGPELTAGTEYWMILTSTHDGEGGALIFWNSALDTNPAGPTSVAHIGASTLYNRENAGLVMRAGVSAIPEPSTYALCFGGAVLGFAVLRRRFRR